MFEKEPWITDVFSFLPVNQLSLAEVQRIFKNHLAGYKDPIYQVSDEPEIICLSQPQLEVILELKQEKRHIAYIFNSQKLIAIIGFI